MLIILLLKGRSVSLVVQKGIINCIQKEERRRSNHLKRKRKDLVIILLGRKGRKGATGGREKKKIHDEAFRKTCDIIATSNYRLEKKKKGLSLSAAEGKDETR